MLSGSATKRFLASPYAVGDCLEEGFDAGLEGLVVFAVAFVFFFLLGLTLLSFLPSVRPLSSGEDSLHLDTSPYIHVFQDCQNEPEQTDVYCMLDFNLN